MGYFTVTSSSPSPRPSGGIRKNTSGRSVRGKVIKVVKGVTKDITIFDTILGRGSYSKVFVGQDDTGRYCAVKVIDITRVEFSKTAKAEETSLNLLNHSNIVKLYGTYLEGRQAYLFLERIEGSDLWKVSQSRQLTGKQVLDIFSQVVEALEHCHSKSIAHRDLKLENLILEPTGKVKLIDFGLSAQYPNSQLEVESVGSPFYMAAEVLNATPYNPFISDIWSLGVVLYLLATGNFPFPADTFDELVQVVNTDEVDYPDSLSSELIDLIRRLLEKNPEKRITIPQIKSHAWFSLLMNVESDQETDQEELEY